MVALGIDDSTQIGCITSAEQRCASDKDAPRNAGGPEEQLDGGTDSSSAAERTASFRSPSTISRASLSGLDQLLQRQMLLLSAQHRRRRLRPAGKAHQAREGAEQRQVLQHVELHWRAAAPSGIAPNP